MKYKIPKSLLMGAATAATQIEGGDYNNNWYQWSQMGMIDNNESSIVACDHWNRVEEDIELMKSLSLETYRMSIEWSRIEPKNGEWSEEGIKHYIDEIDMLISAGIKPLVTLHHFSSPIWIQDIDAWANKKTVDYFVRFVEKVVTFLGERVNEYCTINEPNVFVNDTYMDGKYPGGEKGNIIKYFKASKNMIKAHVLCYDLIHKLRKDLGFDDTLVGVVPHLAYFDLNTKRPFFKLTKKFINQSFHGIFLKGMIEGRLTFPFMGRVAKKGIYSDFIGVNYYTRSMISPGKDIGMLFGDVHYKKNLPEDKKTDLEWEIYPEGLSSVIEELYNKYKLPIYITENGIANADDSKRISFIRSHLIEVIKLIESGVDVRRYYYWSLLDNLEWNDGYGPRFGLIHVDYNTLERTIQESGHYFKNLIESREIEIDEE